LRPEGKEKKRETSKLHLMQEGEQEPHCSKGLHILIVRLPRGIRVPGKKKGETTTGREDSGSDKSEDRRPGGRRHREEVKQYRRRNDEPAGKSSERRGPRTIEGGKETLVSSSQEGRINQNRVREGSLGGYSRRKLTWQVQRKKRGNHPEAWRDYASTRNGAERGVVQTDKRGSVGRENGRRKSSKEWEMFYDNAIEEIHTNAVSSTTARGHQRFDRIVDFALAKEGKTGGLRRSNNAETRG